MPLNPTTEGRPSCDALIADLPDNLLHQIRQYLTIARQLDYNLDAGLKKASVCVRVLHIMILMCRHWRMSLWR